MNPELPMSTAIRAAALIILAAASVPLAAAERRETRNVSGFDAVSLSAPVRLEVIQGDSEGLTLEGDEADLAELETVVENGALKIRPRSHSSNFRSAKTLRGTVSAKSVRALDISGSGDIASRALHGEKLAVSVAGAGDVRVAAAAYSSVKVSISGSGDVTLGGKAEDVTASIAGSGDVKVGALAAKDVKVSIAGSGDATVWASQSLNVSVVGSGDVRYYGEPSIKQSVVGSGTVKRAKGSPS